MKSSASVIFSNTKQFQKRINVIKNAKLKKENDFLLNRIKKISNRKTVIIISYRIYQSLNQVRPSIKT